MTENRPLESRLMELEIQLMHLQHEFDHLNAECLRQQNIIEQQQKRMESLEQHIREQAEPQDSPSH
jgi:uncharacterized coiled-coil protein SlyX